jgi:hypothetical protein
MIVIACHPEDASAIWLHAALCSLCVEEIELVAVEQLVFSRRIVHRLDGAGDSGEIHLADGRVLRAELTTGLINRVQYLPTQHFATAEAEDRAYATEELRAFILAWLDGIAGRVINPSTPFALDGSAFQPAMVAHLAAMAGLRTMPWRAGTTQGWDDLIPGPEATHIAVVFDGRLFGPPLPRHKQEGCRRLAALLGVPLLQISFHQSFETGWRFLAASGAVDFRIGGQPLATAVAEALVTRCLTS